MTRYLALIGGVLLLAGLVCSIGTAYYQVKAVGEARKGLAILGPDKGSPELREKDRLVTLSDWSFGIGLVLTAAGITLQVWSAMLLPAGPVLPAGPAAAAPQSAASARAAPTRYVLWNAYHLEVGLYKEYLKLAFKINAIYYVGVGAILSFFATRRDEPLVWLPLVFLVVLSIFLAGFIIFGARRSGVTRQHIADLAWALGLEAFPEARVLTVLLWLSAVLILLTTVGTIVILLWTLGCG